MLERSDDRHRVWRGLFIAFLVWHCIISVLLLFLAVRTIGIMAGLIPTTTPQTDFSIAGMSVPGLVVGVVFIVVALVVVALGFILFSYCMRSLTNARHAHAGIIVSRVLFVACVAGVLYSLTQAEAVLFFIYLYSSLLTGLIALSLGRIEEAWVTSEAGEADARRAEGSERATRVRTGLERLVQSERSGLSSDEHACRGYATIMLIWGVLKILMGLTAVMSGGAASLQEGSWFAGGFFSSTFWYGVLLLSGGVFDVFCGLKGRRALDSDEEGLDLFCRLAYVGAVVFGLILAGSLVTFVLSPDNMNQVLFAAVLDCALACAVLFFSLRVRHGRRTAAESSEGTSGRKPEQASTNVK